uniref:Polyadenylate-binding protein-interacting protein 2 n=1 Tax=Gallus gallus TaxID=9031 RepID=A0A8V0XTG2_CHICK
GHAGSGSDFTSGGAAALGGERGGGHGAERSGAEQLGAGGAARPSLSAQIEEELWEEEFIERCFQEMLEEEEEHEWFIPARDLPQTMDQIQDQFNDLVISDSSSLEDLVVKSNLNPNAKEFVPGVKYLNI